jgi:F-type H+-transporting ATPase subunit epsilon
MADKITFDLVSPECLLLSTSADMISLPGTEGDMGVMAGHMPLVSTLRPGTVTVTGSEGGKFFVGGGFVEVSAEKCTVLAEDAVSLDELNSEKLNAMIAEADKESQSGATNAIKTKAAARRDSLRQITVVH